MLKLLPVVLILTSIVTTSAPGLVVALKRDAGLDFAGDTNLTDSRFYNAEVQQVTVSDAPLATVSNSAYYNYGAKTQSMGGNSINYVLYRFDLGSLPGFIGGRVNFAQLRLYHASGNGGGSGGTALGQVLTHDWLEGTSTGGYPGAAGGVSSKHPIGYNTAANRNADDGTTPPLASWGIGSDSSFNKSVDGGPAVASSKWGSTGANWTVWTVTDIVSDWATGTDNYGFYQCGNNYLWQTSESGSQYQPVLFIDYSPDGPPDGITDLTVTGTDWYKVDLQWTAPNDEPAGPVKQYDIRYSTSPIIDDASFDAASQCTCPLPTPAAPGTIEHLTILDLTPEMTYYLAIKSADMVGTVSVLSNAPVSATTLPMDVTPPAPITTLAASVIKPNYVTLTWTSVGDDDMTGQSVSYDLRYATSPITDDASFDAATPVTGLAAPKAPGTAETFTLHGLTPATPYWFAIKACDEVPNWSALGNVVTFTTLAPDTSAPDAVTDLRVIAAHITVAYLQWTAPADVDTAGMAGYEVRYSTSLITDATWDQAVPAADVPSPACAGNGRVADGFRASTRYHLLLRGEVFRLRRADQRVAAV